MSRDGAVVEAAAAAVVDEDDVDDDDSWHRGDARNVAVRHVHARRFAFVGVEQQRSMFVSSEALVCGGSAAGNWC